MSDKKKSSEAKEWGKTISEELKGWGDAITGNTNKWRDSDDYDHQIRRK